MNNAHVSEDLFDLIARWDVEVKEIPRFLVRQGNALSTEQRENLLVRRTVMRRLIVELRDTMADMPVRYRGVVNGVVKIEADNEEECWKVVGDQGTVQFKLCTNWAFTDSAIAHQK